MQFNNLPTEIIRMVFYIHVYVHLQSRRQLLFTCRLWHDIAINYGLLWGKVALRTVNSHKKKTEIRCDNLDGLARVINRAGKTFSVEISRGRDDAKSTDEEIERFLKTTGSKWMSGIQTLSIRTTSYDESDPFIETLGKLLGHNSFQSLKRLACDTLAPHSVVTDLFRQMETFALELETLELCIWTSTASIFQHSYLLSRLSSFQLDFCEQLEIPIPWAHFTNLKYLKIYRECHSPLGLSNIVAPHLTSLSLEGFFAQDDFFTHEVLRNLSRLDLELESFSKRMFPPVLPALSFLRLGTWETQIMRWTRVENLIELTLRIGIIPAGVADLDVHSRPHIVHINIEDEDNPENLSPFIGGNYGPFGKHAPIWSMVEQLHLSFFEGVRCLPVSLTKCLQGNQLDPPSFPKLSHLTVRYATPSEKQPSEWEKRTRMYQLLSVMYARMDAGLPQLTKLEVGWHPETNIYSMEVDGEEWCTTEWRDCLQGIGIE